MWGIWKVYIDLHHRITIPVDWLIETKLFLKTYVIYDNESHDFFDFFKIMLD